MQSGMKKKDIAFVNRVGANGLPCKVRVDRNAFEYYPADMDRDMIPICNALNEIAGVRTFFCCSGHGRGHDEFYISLGCRSVRALKLVLKGFDIYGIKDVPPGCKPYRIDPEHSFWPLKKAEVGLRISNRWVSRLKDTERKREFRRVMRILKKGCE